METNLTYSVLYTPDLPMRRLSTNLVCSDKKIHIRFRDFIRPQLISGFERKLAYLVGYIANFTEFRLPADSYNPKVLLTLFNEDENIKELQGILKLQGNIDFKKFKFFPNYKKNGGKLFGEIDKKIFPKIDKEFDLLENFEKTIHVDICTFLLDNAYSILIHENRFDETHPLNKKFINKETRKQARIETETDLVTLW